MTRAHLERLLPAARARYEAELSTVRNLLAAEDHCRGELARLDEMAQAARADAVRIGPMQLLGADLLFQQSLARNRSRLQSDLARILARKANAMDGIRLAFGRKSAIESILAQAVADADHARRERQQSAALEPWLNRAAGR